MRNWDQIAKEAVFTGKDENGNRYLSEFLKDYKDTFSPDIIEAGCRRCLENYYSKLTLSLHKMKKVKNSGYRLKAKYNGIPLFFGSPVQVSNSNLSDEFAERLLKDHPAGEALFESIPEKTEKPVTAKTLAKDNNRDQLDEMAAALGIDPKDLKTKKEVAQAIFTAKNIEVKE